MFTVQQAKKLYETRWWEGEAGIKIPQKNLAIFQLSQNVLCMPYAIFHKAVEDSLGVGIVPDKINYIRHDALGELTGAKYGMSDEACLQILPLHAREAMK